MKRTIISIVQTAVVAAAVFYAIRYVEKKLSKSEVKK